ncbi:hypothetical protein AAK899_05505 [Erysipelotrichaceae bacterium 51-3]
MIQRENWKKSLIDKSGLKNKAWKSEDLSFKRGKKKKERGRWQPSIAAINNSPGHSKFRRADSGFQKNPEYIEL